MEKKQFQEVSSPARPAETRAGVKGGLLIRLLFAIAAVYDGLLGLAFLVAWRDLFGWFNVTLPNHPGYVQFPGLLLIIFGLMFLAVARNPIANRNLIPYGILLKVAYCGVIFYHQFTAGIPGMWLPFAWIDLAFLILFFWAYAALAEKTQE
ncbi:MAG: hypothetical protein ACYC7E_14535 [Armatimonadota bacterium]